MWTVLVLLVLCILSIALYLPLPVVVILFALVSGTAATMWFSWTARERNALGRVEPIVEAETELNS